MRFLIVVSVLVSCLAAQPDLEARIRQLEARAAEADVLEARVKDLEARLESTELDERDARLAESVNAILTDVRDEIAVRSRRAQGLIIGGQLRMRTEHRTVSLYNVADPRNSDEDVTVNRARINFDARVLDDVRVFMELQDSRLWGEEMSPITDQMGVDLHQGYADFEGVFGSSFTVRSGRFELALWNQRLVSPLDWHPVGRAWDGVLVFGEPTEDLLLHAGYHTLAEGVTIDSDEDDDLYWGAATYTGVEDHEFGAAFFWLHADTGGADISFGTATVHAEGTSGGFDYSVDLVAQTLGEVGPADVEAYASAVTLGYTFEGDWAPRLGVEWTWASGDDDPTDGEIETFNPLYPFGHSYQGYLDLFAWRNGHDVALHLSAKPASDWWAEIAVHSFWLDQTEDAWYGASGAPIRLVPTADDHHVGWEIDISVKHWIAENVWIWFGYSHFFAGDYVSETGPSPDTNWFWMQVTLDF